MKTNNEDPIITDIQRFCMHDGDGIRTTVFFKGCPLRCKWCHNPETVNPNPELLFSPTKCIECGACSAVCPSGARKAGNERDYDREKCISCGKCAEICPTGAFEMSGKISSVREIIEEVKKDMAFYGKEGGLTVSGGEPTFRLKSLISLLKAAKDEGISTCVETCGVFPPSAAEKLVPLCDLFLFDIKDTDKTRLRENTGAELDKVLSNLILLDSLGAPTVLRCIMIPDVNMNDSHAENIACIFKKLTNSRYVELLPYHPFGTSKAERLGKKDTAVFRRPERLEVMSFADRLARLGVPTKCFGEAL